MLTESVNPALAAATARAPVTIIAPPQDCSLQFDPVGKAKFVSSCDIAKSALTNAGVPYQNIAAPSGATTIRIGSSTLVSPDGHKLAPLALSAAKTKFAAALKRAMAIAGYPLSATPSAISIPRSIAILLVFMVAAAALYGPQAAALVELFPTRIRYTALSVPYHVGVGWFGGFLPATAFAIVAATGDIYAGLWYPVIIAAIGFVVTLFFLPETFRRSIES
jgi:hypothetical protein